MADAVTTQIIQDGPKNAVIKFTNISDGTGEDEKYEEVDTTKVKQIYQSNGKWYSNDNRWKEHFKASQKAEGGCPMVKRAIQKYGFDKIEKQILLEIDNEFLNEYEQKFIKQYNTLSPNGYNCTSGGDGGKLLCEKTKEKIGKTAKQNCLKIAKGSIQPNKKGHFCLRYGRSKKTIGTYETRELAEKAFIIWKETGTVSEEGRIKRGNGSIKKNGKRQQ